MLRPLVPGVLLLALAACSTPVERKAAPAPAAAAPLPEPCMQTGMASWYRPKPASALIAAHATLPLGTQLLVTELAGGRSVVVRIADRGPFTKGRIIDLSSAAAGQLGMRQNGVAQVRLEIYQPSQPAAMTGTACPFRQDTAAN